MSKDTIHVFNNLNVKGIIANGEIGTVGQILHSNGSVAYWALDDNSGGTITSVATANGLSGGPITTTGTIGVVTGSTLTVNTTGIHVNSALSITDLALTGNLTVSGTRTYINTTTLEVGDNIVTLNADLGANPPTENAGIEIMRGTSANAQFIWDETNDRWSTNSQPLAISSLVAAGAASGITTLAAGNTTVTGSIKFGNNASTSDSGALIYGPDGYGFTSEFNSAVVLRNEQGGIEQTLYLGDTSLGNAATIFGISQGTSAVLNLTGAGQLTVNNIVTTTNTATFGTAAYIVANGNVGIGTSSPAYRLHVVAADGVTGSFFAGASYALRVQSIAATGTVVDAVNNTEATYQPLLIGGSLTRFMVSGLEKMRLDASGNLGINVEPVAGYGKSIQLKQSFGATGTFLFQAVDTDLQNLEILNNALPPAGGYTAGYNYTHTGSSATKYASTGGNHIWYSASSGTAGSAITFGERMRITLTGNVGIGNTAPNSKLVVAGTVAMGNTTITGFANVIGNIASRNLLMQGDDTNAYIRPTNSPSNLYLGSNNSNIVTIFSNGHLNTSSSLAVAGALSGVTTAAMGNTTITGFANVSTSVNSAMLTVGTSFIANSSQLTISSGGSAVSLSNGTSNRITWGTGGVAAPTLTSYSAGTKLVLYDSVSAGSTGYAIGIDNATVWFSTNLITDAGGFKWYGGTTNYMSANATILSHTGSIHAPIFKDSDNTAFFFDGASTTNINTLSGNGKTALETADGYLRINQSASFTNGIWTGSSNFLNSSGIFGWGSNGGTTSSRVYINGGTYNGTNVIALDGSNGRITALDVRAPVFYDSDNPAYYIDPASTSNLYGLTVNQAITGSVTGYSTYLPTRYDSGQKTNPQQYFGQSIGLRVAMTAMPVVWADTLWINGYAGGDVLDMCALHFSRQGTPRMWITTQQSTATSYGTFYEFPSLGYNSGNTSDLYAGIFKDSNNTAYYVDSDSTSRMNAISLDQVNVGDGTFLFKTGAGSGTTRHLNMSTYGGDPSQAQTGQSGITWGYRSDNEPYYMIHLTHGDYSGHTKLSLSWHTGIRIGAGAIYGGTAFYDNSLNAAASPNLIFTVGRGDNNVRSLTSFRAPIMYDIDNGAYYVDPASESVLSTLSLFGELNLSASSINYIDHTGTILFRNQTGYATSASLTTGGDFTATGSMRAPIFYDSNNTAYYIDAASNSVLNTLSLGGRATTYAMYYQGFTLDANTMDHNATGFTYAVNAPHVGPIVRLSAGSGYDLQLNAPYSGNGNKLSYRTRQGDAGIFNSWYAVATYGVSYTGELFATKFTDADSSGYYCDPASNSAFDALTIRKSGISLGTGNSRQLEINNAASGACNISFHREGQYGAHFGLDTDNWFSTLGWSAGGGYTSMRVGAIQADVYIRRTHSSGHLRGGYNNIGSSEGQTSPIYTIGSSYEPAATTLSNMYGIGFTASGSFLPSGNSGWGMYVASDGNARVWLSGGDGSIIATGNITAYASDRRLKTNIIPISNAIDKLMQINGVEFDWVENIQDIGFIPQQMHETGVIAQEIQAVIPDAVKTAPFNNNATDIAGFDSDYLTVDKEKIIPLLIEAIKEQQAHINKLETKINSFEQRLI